MSIVGTRPPLISETNLYEPHHKVTSRPRACVSSRYMARQVARIWLTSDSLTSW